MIAGRYLAKTWANASAAKQAAAQQMSQSFASASDAIARRAKAADVRAREMAARAAKAAIWTGEKIADAAERVGNQAVDAAVWTKDRSVDVGKEVTATTVALTAVAIYATGKALGGAYRAGPVDNVIEGFNKVGDMFRDGPCLHCESGASSAERAKRIVKRNALIRVAKTSADPDQRPLAALLEQDMDAIDLARLSNDAYYPSPTRPPLPAPWTVVSDEKLAVLGIDKQDLITAKATIYKLPKGFPGGPKTVLAFQGTVPTLQGDAKSNDLLANHDQAMNSDTTQYKSAIALGKAIGSAKARGKIDGDVMVTGHSLGGGKAQAAGVQGKLKGMMFNSAGLHDKTVPDGDLQAAADRFTQYRSTGDPLTGLQNSPKKQKLLVELLKVGVWTVGNLPDAARLAEMLRKEPVVDELLKRVFGRDGPTTLEKAAANKNKYGYYIPRARGSVVEVIAKDKNGRDASDSLADQHDLVNHINGIEYRKYETIKSLRKSQGNPGRQGDYIAGGGTT